MTVAQQHTLRRKTAGKRTWQGVHTPVQENVG